MLLFCLFTSHIFTVTMHTVMYTCIGGSCSLSESDCNESDEEVWNEDFDADLENGSEIYSSRYHTSNCFGKLVAYLCYIPSINISSLRQRS